MNLNINHYTAWANRHIGGDMNAAATLSNGSIADIKTTTSGWDRFIRSDNFTRQREAVRADFQRALTERFGSLVSNAVMKGVGSNLTATAITKAVSTAKTLAMRSALTPQNERCFKLTDGDLVLSQAAIGGMSRDGRKALNLFLKMTNAVATQLGTLPIGDKEMAAFRANNEKLIVDIVKAKSELVNAFGGDLKGLRGDDLKRLLKTCDAQVGKLKDHLAHVSALNENSPTSTEATNRFRDTWYAAFKQACADLKQDERIRNNPDAVAALEELRNTSKNVFAGEFELSKDFGKFLAKVIEQSLKTACGSNPLGKDGAKKAVSKAYEHTLNAGSWNAINKAFSGTLAGNSFKITSTITPGGKVPGIGDTYPQGVNGYMCHSSEEKQHAVNLAISTVKVEGQDGNETTAFTGVRHGVHCAWDVDDANERAQANRNRASEAVKAALTAYLANHAAPESGEIELPMTSVSLLTPDCFRPVFCGKNSNEKKMLLEQTAAWKAIDGKQMEIEVNGRTYKVKPKIATFNFAVNNFGVGMISGIGGGWGVSRPMNKEAIAIVKDRVKAFLGNPGVSGEKKLVAQKLFRQIAQILNEETESTDGNDAYKAAARLAVLTSVMDGVPCWNCKSGKDRTGEMDVECKFLATLIARDMDIPEPGAELTSEQKNLFRTIALESGNHEMQEYNTGLAGFKTDSVSSITERLGGDDAKTFHKGGADYVGV